MKPYLFIDIDGVLNPERKLPRFETYEILGFTVHLKVNHGKQLLRLAEYYELVWATTWTNDANVHIGPKVGLPELPYVSFGSMRYPSTRPGNGPMIKTLKVVEYANGNPFAWIDDDLQHQDLDYIKEQCKEALPLSINSMNGLTRSDLKLLRHWGEEQRDKTVQANSTE